jgi:hypothetical protein
VSAQFFRVDGADQETGEETYLVLQAPTKPQAEKLARQQGLLISAVRVARPDDWSGSTEPEAPAEAPLNTEPAPPPEPELAPELHNTPEMPIESSPFVEAQAPLEPVPQPLDPAPALPAVASSRQNSSAGAVFLGSIGVALVVGGVLALVLALWPDNAIRNELEQIEFRLHEVSQTILGGILVLGGLMIFVLAVFCHLISKRTASM